jgi:hypothetical protein
MSNAEEDAAHTGRELVVAAPATTNAEIELAEIAAKVTAERAVIVIEIIRRAIAGDEGAAKFVAKFAAELAASSVA